MRTFIFSLIILGFATLVVCGVRERGGLENSSKDADYLTDTPQVSDVREIRGLFERAIMSKWNICGYTIDYPSFMRKEEVESSSSMRVYYQNVTMIAKVFTDDYRMTLNEKYAALNMSAITKSIKGGYYLTAGRMGGNMRYFEKFISLEQRKWLYIRVEFPKELTWAVDPLLHYVLDYKANKESIMIEK